MFIPAQLSLTRSSATICHAAMLLVCSAAAIRKRPCASADQHSCSPPLSSSVADAEQFASNCLLIPTSRRLRNWLSRGFQVAKVAAGRTVVEFSERRAGAASPGTENSQVSVQCTTMANRQSRKIPAAAT